MDLNLVAHYFLNDKELREKLITNHELKFRDVKLNFLKLVSMKILLL